jgi:hypothetical protein
VETTISSSICEKAGAAPILAIKIADKANTVRRDLIEITLQLILFKVMKNIFD